MQSVAFIASITRSYKAYFLHTNKSYIFSEQFLFHAPMTTYLKDLTQSIGRYDGLSWQKLGLRIFGSTSSISTWCKEFGQHEGERQAQPCWMIHDNIIYIRCKKTQPIMLFSLSNVNSLACHILMCAHNHKRCPRQYIYM